MVVETEAEILSLLLPQIVELVGWRSSNDNISNEHKTVPFARLLKRRRKDLYMVMVLWIERPVLVDVLVDISSSSQRILNGIMCQVMSCACLPREKLNCGRGFFF